MSGLGGFSVHGDVEGGLMLGRVDHGRVGNSECVRWMMSH